MGVEEVPPHPVEEGLPLPPLLQVLQAQGRSGGESDRE